MMLLSLKTAGAALVFVVHKDDAAFHVAAGAVPVIRGDLPEAFRIGLIYARSWRNCFSR
jgi:hypothetical protein